MDVLAFAKLGHLPLPSRLEFGSTMATDFVVPFAGAALVGLGVYWLTKPKRDHLPPGPKRYPILGNLLNFPRDHFYDAFTKWQKEYGAPTTYSAHVLNH
jgi:hypothetical protein